MNVGQILETHLGWALRRPRQAHGPDHRRLLCQAGHKPLKETLKKRSTATRKPSGRFNDAELMELGGNLRHGVPIATPVFDGAKEADIEEMLKLAGLDAFRTIDRL